MKRRCRTPRLSIICLFGVILASHFCPQDALGAREGSGANLSVAVENNMASADIQGATVAKVIQKLEQEFAIVFYADESILNEIVYVQFSNLPLQAGMMKIFSGMNFIFYFLPNGTITEVALLGKKGTEPAGRSFRFTKREEDKMASSAKPEEGRPKRAERPWPRGQRPQPKSN